MYRQIGVSMFGGRENAGCSVYGKIVSGSA